MSDPNAPVEEKKIIVNKIDTSDTDSGSSQEGGSHDDSTHNNNNNQDGGSNDSDDVTHSPISAESKAKLDAMDIMDATEFGLAPNPEQGGGSSNGINQKKKEYDQNGGYSKHGKSLSGGDKTSTNMDNSDESDENNMLHGGSDTSDTVVVDNDGEPEDNTGKSGNHIKSLKGGRRTKKSSRRESSKANYSGSSGRSTIVDVALPMGGKAVVPFSMPKSLNISDLKKKFENEYKKMRSMKSEERRRRIAELEAILFEDPSANDLASGLLDIVDDRALKCMAMKALLAKGI